MTPRYVLRPMVLDDIQHVVQIDQASFPTPWSSRTYEFEINNRHTSHLVVLEYLEEEAPAKPKSILTRLKQWTTGSLNSTSKLVGYGGYWLIAGEVHISTIAVHPNYRGQSLGELLLAGMLRRGTILKGEYSVLEVRISNTTAQALYRKYEYETVGRRRNYYRDNGEDAFLMEVRPLDDAYQQRLEARIENLKQRICYDDQFSHA